MLVEQARERALLRDQQRMVENSSQENSLQVDWQLQWLELLVNSLQVQWKFLHWDWQHSSSQLREPEEDFEAHSVLSPKPVHLLPADWSLQQAAALEHPPRSHRRPATAVRAIARKSCSRRRSGRTAISVELPKYLRPAWHFSAGPLLRRLCDQVREDRVNDQ